MGQIKITGYAEKKYAADVIEYNVTFYGSDSKLDKAIERVSSACETFLTELGKTGIDVKDVRLERDNFGEEYHGERKMKSASRTLFFRQGFNARLTNIVNEIIRANGLDAQLSTSFSLSGMEEKKNELLREAIRDSRRKAEIIAAANDQVIKGIELVQDERYRDDFYEEETRAMAFNDCCEEARMCKGSIMDDLSSKEITLSQTVYVSWLIE